MSDSSWFVDDIGAYDKYEREEQSDDTEQKVIYMLLMLLYFCIHP